MGNTLSLGQFLRKSFVDLTKQSLGGIEHPALFNFVESKADEVTAEVERLAAGDEELKTAMHNPRSVSITENSTLAQQELEDLKQGIFPQGFRLEDRSFSKQKLKAFANYQGESFNNKKLKQCFIEALGFSGTHTEIDKMPLDSFIADELIKRNSSISVDDSVKASIIGECLNAIVYGDRLHSGILNDKKRAENSSNARLQAVLRAGDNFAIVLGKLGIGTK